MLPTVRPSLRREIDGIREISQLAYQHYVERMGQRPGPMDTDYHVEHEKGHLYSVLLDGRLVGYLGLGDPDPGRPEDLEVDNIALLPEVQGLGLFGSFIRASDWIAFSSGKSRLHLYTHIKMTENIGLYHKVGFEDIGVVHEKGFERLYMAKPVFSERQRSLPGIAERWERHYPEDASLLRSYLASLPGTEQALIHQSSIGVRVESGVGRFELARRPREWLAGAQNN